MYAISKFLGAMRLKNLIIENLIIHGAISTKLCIALGVPQVGDGDCICALGE